MIVDFRNAHGRLAAHVLLPDNSVLTLEVGLEWKFQCGVLAPGAVEGDWPRPQFEAGCGVSLGFIMDSVRDIVRRRGVPEGSVDEQVWMTAVEAVYQAGQIDRAGRDGGQDPDWSELQRDLAARRAAVA